MRLRKRCLETDTLLQLSEGKLHGRRLRACRRHVRRCPRCQQEMAAAAGLRRLLSAAPAPVAPADLGARLVAALPKGESVPTLTCRQARLLIPASLDGEVSRRQEERLWAHLFQCAPCLRRYREAEKLVTAARRRQSAPAPAYLLQRILAALAQPASAPPRRRALRPAPVALAVAGAAALALAALITLRSPNAGPVPAPPPLPGSPEVASPGSGEAPAGVAEVPAAGVAESPPLPSAATPEPRRGSPRSPVEASTPPPAAAAVPPTPPVAPTRAAAYAPASPPTPAATPPAPAYVPPPAPARAPEPISPPALPPAPAPAPPAPMALAAAPPAPAAAPPVSPPSGREALPPRPVVAHSEPEAVRQLRWTPSQGSSVLVIQRAAGDRDTALADVNQALNQYGRELKRTQPKRLVVVH